MNSLQNDLFFFKNQIITIGFEHEDEKIDSEGFTAFGSFIIDQLTNANRQTKSAYLQDQITVNDLLFVTLGARYDNPDDFNSEVTFKATASYQLAKKSRLHTAYGTGFKAPSLFQLFGHTPNNFGSEFKGNPDLDPETSKSWEIGLEQSFWKNKVNIDLTYFRTDIEDLITTVFLPGFNSTTINLNDVRTHGIESSINLVASTDIDVNLNYTFTRTKNEDDTELLRRPKHNASLDVEYRTTDKMTLGASLLHIGSRQDIDGLGSRVKMGSYNVINLAANYQLNKNTRLFTRIDNFGNNTYEPAYGFQAVGFAGYLGFELTNR